jgi:hypothetical protein
VAALLPQGFPGFFSKKLAGRMREKVGNQGFFAFFGFNREPHATGCRRIGTRIQNFKTEMLKLRAFLRRWIEMVEISGVFQHFGVETLKWPRVLETRPKTNSGLAGFKMSKSVGPVGRAAGLFLHLSGRLMATFCSVVTNLRVNCGWPGMALPVDVWIIA